MSTYEIEHQPEEQLFFVNIEDGQRAFLKYRRLGNRAAQSAVDFWSTFVPESHRGTGLASKLVEHGFAWAKAQGFHIDTSCWYAAKILADKEA
ncbi:hypothetical protein NBRC116583_30280 [Arenicella sp. 4NH20-0111]|uniref:GNAT family N-acetyltransferase n=1 Tax=Arenicella sp. 4NH20-0111 TaxID=3127648 RepID=UPI003104B2DC